MAARTRIPFQHNGSSILPPYQTMSAGQFLQSPNGRFKLVLQPDGNLVLQDNGAQVWVADASQPYSNTLVLRQKIPSAFYIQYSAFLDDPSRKRTWASVNTTFTDKDQWNRTHMILQNDGNMLLVDFGSLWNSNGALPPDPAAVDALVFPAETALEIGKFYVAGASRLVFQADGNLVVFGPAGGAIWASHTQGQGAVRAVMQADGNFVLLNAANGVVWQTGTAGRTGAFARLQPNGGFSIAFELPVWARFGFTPVLKPRRVFYPDHGTGPLPTWKDWTWSF
ncbi:MULTISPECIES: putidacin L1 family lectin-like bacteriocin [unclassified Pseudomonas]|uniref:putidacin L1 family lectin-like bacteriocin n=1 Tax=unclassified Pseudomonas TaxID=196821 RepID=UPI00075C60A5|nr:MULTISPECIES: putidacin L1 family lectin-like bacteriocin [unclassified Pseudomonas]KVV01755.1 D-mannose binding lectin [Pseudomonas sp. TAD18]KVV03325.1 D-mannose binding lectin [Pseudomonas sp. TAA207]